MNIKEAKEEILRTIRAYRETDETGAYVIPPEQQRPVLLMGPPGIGKTAVMRQAAEEAGVNLVSYTITHHTRQSAIGLPMISHRQFQGEEYAVTEYTMSEIVSSVYESMEKTGVREGILFLDEINCASETLSPTMLQFLQYKTFGTHRVPEGWIIVTAGNPPQYNRSAREFDIVTLDRVKRMDIEPDLDVWKEYAVSAGINGAVLSYLTLKRQNFYVIRTEVGRRYFVTARGWEDLSRMLGAYEKAGEPVSEQLAVQYLQDEEVARDFAVYYDLYQRYRKVYRVDDILDGAKTEHPEAIKEIPFDEKYSLIRLLADGLHREFVRSAEAEAVQGILYERLTAFRDAFGEKNTGTKEKESEAAAYLRETADGMRRGTARREEARVISAETARTERLAASALERFIKEAAENGESADSLYMAAREWFSEREEERGESGRETDRRLTNALAFINSVYGVGQEMVMLLTELNADRYCLRFVREYGNESFRRYNRLLLIRDREEALRGELLQMPGQMLGD